MSSKKQLEKLEFVVTAIVNNYFIVHQKMALLSPLLEDKDLFERWNHTEGASAAEAMRMTLYMAVLSDMRALLFDADKRTASLGQVIDALKNSNLVNALRKNFVDPPPTTVVGHDSDPEMRDFIAAEGAKMYMDMTGKRFDELLPETIRMFEKFQASDLAIRVDSARSKIISHKELQSVEGERRLYSPVDCGLRWEDAEDIVTGARDLIFNANMLVNCSSYDLDSFFSAHINSAQTFWSIPKKA